MNDDELQIAVEPQAEVIAQTLAAEVVAQTIGEERLPATDLVVIAKNPMEMAQAQASLIQWSQRKLVEVRADHAELEESYKVALRSKWKSDTLKRHAAKALKRVVFYEKVQAALEAGFCIVPNFPIDVFAIRTTKEFPKRHGATETNSWGGVPAISDQASNTPPVGEGAYVDSVAKTESCQSRVASTKPGADDLIRTSAWASAFKDVDFPFALAKPDVLTATSKAMALKIFDDIGISPARPGRGVRTANGDPMVIGRIILGSSNIHQERVVSFLVTWFVDTKDI